MRYLLFFLFLSLPFFLFSKNAIQGCDITLKIEGYAEDTLWLGHTYGRRTVEDYPAARQADGSFRLLVEQQLPEGLYAIVYKNRGSKNFLSIWIADSHRQFKIDTKLNDLLGFAIVDGSPETLQLWSYLFTYQKSQKNIDYLTNQWKVFQDEPTFRAMVAAQEQLKNYQEQFLAQNQGSPVANFIAPTLFVTPASTTSADWQTASTARHQWFRQYYFDKMDLGSGNFLKNPLWVERTDYYFYILPPPAPDSMKVMIEEVLDRLSPDADAYQYYLGYIINSVSGQSRYSTDEVYVYLVEKYLKDTTHPSFSENRLARHQSDAAQMKPLFKGNKASNLTLYNKQGEEVSLYDISANYTLLVFWLYDCSNCKKELPLLIKWYEANQSKGIEVLSVCGKIGAAETEKCVAFAEEIQMPKSWHVLNDPYNRSRFYNVFNVRSYPRLFLLDDDKNILAKVVGAMPEDVLMKELEVE